MDSEISAFANTSIRGVAALIAGVVTDNLYLEECLIMWLTDTNGDASMLPLGARRAAMAVLAADEGKLKSKPRPPRAIQRLHVVVGVDGARHCFFTTGCFARAFEASGLSILPTDCFYR
jgi:hypothetical protein